VGCATAAPADTAVGRARDLGVLNRWIADGCPHRDARRPGGVGKTRLALEVAHQVADGGAMRVVSSNCALRDAASVASAIAEASARPT
jgi:hypothetical protein